MRSTPIAEITTARASTAFGYGALSISGTSMRSLTLGQVRRFNRDVAGPDHLRVHLRVIGQGADRRVLPVQVGQFGWRAVSPLGFTVLEVADGMAASMSLASTLPCIPRLRVVASR